LVVDFRHVERCVALGNGVVIVIGHVVVIVIGHVVVIVIGHVVVVTITIRRIRAVGIVAIEEAIPIVVRSITTPTWHLPLILGAPDHAKSRAQDEHEVDLDDIHLVTSETEDAASYPAMSSRIGSGGRSSPHSVKNLNASGSPITPR